MLAGVIKVDDFNGSVTEAGNTIPDPLCTIAQYNDFLRLLESALRRFQVHMAGKGLCIFKGDHVSDAYSFDANGAISLWQRLRLVDRGYFDLFPSLLQVGCRAINADVQAFWRFFSLHLRRLRRLPGLFRSPFLSRSQLGPHP
jgi:hypothetical protein